MLVRGWYVFCNFSVLPLSIIMMTLVCHYNDVIMSEMASQITSLTIVYSGAYSGGAKRKHQSSASLGFVRGIHRSPLNSPHKGPVMRKMFLFDGVILSVHIRDVVHHYGWQQYSEVMAGPWFWFHYRDIIMSAMASQTIDMSLLGSTICSGMDQRKRQRSVSLAFVRGIHQWLVDSPHKGPVTQKMFPFDDVIMQYQPTMACLQYMYFTASLLLLWCSGWLPSNYFSILQGHISVLCCSVPLNGADR